MSTLGQNTLEDVVPNLDEQLVRLHEQMKIHHMVHLVRKYGAVGK